MPLNPVDTDARWKTARAGRASGLQYQEDVIVDLSGFILSRGVTHASEREFKAVPGLLEGLPLQPVPLGWGTPATATVGSGVYWRDRASPRTSPSIPGKRPAWWPAAISCITATTRSAPRERSCAGARTTNGNGRTCTLRVRSIVELVPSRTAASRRGRNGGTSACRRASICRKTIAEGTFASLDRFGWEKSRLRGLWKVDCEGYMVALAHNVPKMMPTLGHGVWSPGPVAPEDAIAVDAWYGSADAVADSVSPSWSFAWLSCWIFHLEPAPR